MAFFFIFSVYTFILLGKHDLINVWVWFQATECRLLNNYFMASIYSQEKAELSPPSIIQAVGCSPIVDSEPSGHVFQYINPVMVTHTHSQVSTREEMLLQAPEACDYRSCTPERKNKAQTKPGSQCLPPSQLRFPQHRRNPILHPLPYRLADDFFPTWTKHKTAIWNSWLHRATSLCTGLTGACVGTGDAENSV